MFSSTKDAIRIAKNESLPELEREKALRYLEVSTEPEVLEVLINALEDVDPGVRWAAAEVVAAQGERAFKYLLEALCKPNNKMLRDGAKVVIHRNSSEKVKVNSEELLNALSGPGSDIRTMEIASKLLIDWD
jgi:HEAT repeat protein